jgi:transcriptional regulator with XRE-family HTH domain
MAMGRVRGMCHGADRYRQGNYLAGIHDVKRQGNLREEFPARLRWWRRHRGWSQLELAGRAEISQRHLSFLELGRAAASRQMVLRLAHALEVPLRQHNALLVAAGYAPVWRESELGARELAQIARAVDYMLAQQEPFPAVAVDRHWNLLKANGGAKRLIAFLLGPPPPEARVNLADALVAPDVLRPFLVNWPEVVRYFIRSVEADAAADASPETATLLRRLLAYPGVTAALRQPLPERSSGPVLAMHFCKQQTAFSLFTCIATLGTPLHVTAEELRVESFFPLDAASAEIFRDWAGDGQRRSPSHAARARR